MSQDHNTAIATVLQGDLTSTLDLGTTAVDVGRGGVLDVHHPSTITTDRFEAARFFAGDHSSCGQIAGKAVLIVSLDSHGQLMSRFDGQQEERTVKSGHITFVPAGIKQEYDFRGETTNHYMLLRDSLFDELRADNPELADIRMDEPWNGWFRPRLAQMVIEHNRLVLNKEMGWRSLSEAFAVQLGVELMKAYGNRTVAGPTALSAGEVEQVSAFVRENLEGDISLEDAASLLGRDSYGFSRAFKAATGGTYHDMVITARLNEAERLLTKTDDTLVDIALACGFSSQSHFTTTMNRRLGVTPGRLRRVASS